MATDKNERVEMLISRLSGTCNSMDTECDELGLDPMDDMVTASVDAEIFNCTTCGWWCPIDEESSEAVGHDEWICSDCAEGM